MRRDPVVFVETRERVCMRPVPDHFRFVPKSRWKDVRGRVHQWLQRKAWAFLQRSTALEQAFEDKIEFTRHVIDTDNVVYRLIEQKIALYEGYDREGTELLIGRETFAELMNAPEIRHDTSFSGEYFVHGERGPRVMGLRVRVIPWMRGMLVMP
jgi:hypothetical protein